MLVLVVVAASSTGVRLAGFLAALSSGVFFDLFLTQPNGTLAVAGQIAVAATSSTRSTTVPAAPCSGGRSGSKPLLGGVQHHQDNVLWSRPE